ncbi:MAG: transporter substrate-binding domain-containing protein [Proteobacteria bacterium]|nr:transporter substrate-binding domain-containing protein [Pseudomonadota bacterium]
MLTDAVLPFTLFMIIALIFIKISVCGICQADDAPQEIRIGTELDFPPYAFADKRGQPSGFSIELIKAVTDAMGLSITISSDSWDAVWESLIAGRIDALPIVAKLPERQRLVDFSLPHTETYDAFFLRQEDSPIKSIASAQGMEIVVMRSDIAHHELQHRRFQGLLVLVDTMPEGLSLVSSGKHNAFLCSKLIGTLLIKTHGLKGLKVGPPIPDYKRVFSFAVKKGDTELLEKLNQGLLIVKTNGEYNRIYNKWLTADDPWLKVRKYLLPAIIGVATMALIAVIWLVTLQRTIMNRNSELDRRKRAEATLKGTEKIQLELLEKLNAAQQIAMIGSWEWQIQSGHVW